jgi:hypothetical protein
MEEPGTDRKTRRAVEIFAAQIARDRVTHLKFARR